MGQFLVQINAGLNPGRVAGGLCAKHLGYICLDLKRTVLCGNDMIMDCKVTLKPYRPLNLI
jgi:hypothetical protein